MLFESERMYYRVWQSTDLQAGIDLWGNPQVMNLIEPPLSQGKVAMSIQRGIEHYEKYQTQLFAMVLKETDAIIGCCGFSCDNFQDKVYEFGVHIMPDHQSKGYGYEAGLAAINYIKDTLEVNQIIAACHVDNLKSEALLKKLKFDYKGELWFDDTNRYEKYFEINL